MSQLQFQQFVAALVPSWRRGQHKVLALCVRALVIRRRCGLWALREGLIWCPFQALHEQGSRMVVVGDRCAPQ